MSGVKRPRQILSCVSCRRRRLKCDKTHPSCSRCAASSIRCVYATDVEAESSSASNNAARQSDPTTQSRQSTALNSASDSPSLQELHRTPQLRSGYLDIDRGGGSSYLSPTFWATSGLEMDPDLQQYAQGVDVLPTLLAQRETTLSLSDPKFEGFTTGRYGSLYKCRLCGQRCSIACVLATLPSKQTCDRLLNTFAAYIYPLVPIIDFPGFVDDYHSFWRENEKRDWHISVPGPIVREKPSLVCLIFSILFCASMNSRDLVGSTSQEDDEKLKPAQLYFGTIASLTLIGFPRRSTVNSLAAYVFSQTQLSREEEFPHSPASINTAFRVALGMGLHRDGNEFGLDPLQAEIRRRLWWYIIHIDVMASSSSGLPPLLFDEALSSTSMIGPFERVAEKEGGSNTFNSSVADVRYLTAVARYTATQRMRKILCLHLGNKLCSVDEIAEVETRLEELRLFLKATTETLSHTKEVQRPSEQGSVGNALIHDWTTQSDNYTVVSFCAWARSLLHLYLHKAYVILYHPLMKMEDQGPWMSRRTRAIQHAQAFLRIFSQFCTDPRFEPFSWMYPGAYQPLQQLSLLLADLLDHAYSEEAATSRGLVDAMFAFYQVDEGIVRYYQEGSDDTYQAHFMAGPSAAPSFLRRPYQKRNLSPAGRNAWMMLVNARRRALTQIGQDPHVLWPTGLTRRRSSKSEPGSQSTSAARCVCGGLNDLADETDNTAGNENVARRTVQRSEAPLPSTTQSAAPSTGVSHIHDGAMEEVEMSFSPPQNLPPETMAFDWHEWDAALSSSLGQ